MGGANAVKHKPVLKHIWNTVTKQVSVCQDARTVASADTQIRFTFVLVTVMTCSDGQANQS